MGGGKKVCAWLLANCEVQLCSALAAVSILGVVVVCPVMLDPAIETLASSFEKAQCQTLYSKYLIGLSNCTWTSCREGCTADIYSCWHILVIYLKEDDLKPMNNSVTPTQDQKSRRKTSSDVSRNNLTQSAPIALRKKTMKTLETEVNYSGTTKMVLPSNLFEYVNDCLSSGKNLTSLGTLLFEMQLCLGNFSLRYKTNLKALHSGIGALFPNQQKCVYPSETVCEDYYSSYGRVGTGRSFDCLVSASNATTVVTTVDKMGAIRNILYCFIPLFIAGGVFTYLFYRVGLIGGGRQKLKDEEENADTKPQQLKPTLPNGAPPGAPKKLRKKFLPKRKDSSKKRRQRKGFKKNAMVLKNQLSIRSATSSRRTPSFSTGDVSIEGRRPTNPKLYTSIGSKANTKPNPSLLVESEDGNSSYLPAYELKDLTSERDGRH